MWYNCLQSCQCGVSFFSRSQYHSNTKQTQAVMLRSHGSLSVMPSGYPIRFITGSKLRPTHSKTLSASDARPASTSPYTPFAFSYILFALNTSSVRFTLVSCVHQLIGYGDTNQQNTRRPTSSSVSCTVRSRKNSYSHCARKCGAASVVSLATREMTL